MVQTPTSFDLSEAELKKLSSEEKARVIKEWSSRIANAKNSISTSRSGYGTHGYNATPRHDFSHMNTYTNRTNTYISPTYRGAYRGYSGGPLHAHGASHEPTFNETDRSRHHPYATSRNLHYQNRMATFVKDHNTHTTHEQAKMTITKPCSAFTLTGICTRPGCRYVHDQNKVAICKDFLYKNNCPDGDGCPLSHTPSPHNTIACNHFRKGTCTKDDCRFAHVRVNPSAALCETFSRLGYCEKGNICADRHAFDECPDYTNKGECRAGAKCQFTHVVHAGRLRKARPSTETDSPVSRSSPEVIILDDDSSNTLEANTTPEISMNDDSKHGFTQQADFVPFM
ncbi:hypothetical protein K504DRAFT_38537 [Pleomassaria siparia CBS 279.74]|uniref:C3H1-type domain-containing protein n=1 Tax=Pleomassaria siparia CBS 279.74 TaxID=1314801 RepID=A0A6G1K3V8_9PLEO|nr:hypothetical protein K504DRAFT_38537 [Pleomassaria siparia CBS 279.74]